MLRVRLAALTTLAAATLVVAACATASPRTDRAPTVPTERLAFGGEIAAAHPDMPADEALGRARPELLRNSYRSQPVQLYIDRRPADISALHAIPARMVAEVRMLTPVEASLEYGPWHDYPILAVTLVHGR